MVDNTIQWHITDDTDAMADAMVQDEVTEVTDDTDAMADVMLEQGVDGKCPDSIHDQLN